MKWPQYGGCKSLSVIYFVTAINEFILTTYLNIVEFSPNRTFELTQTSFLQLPLTSSGLGTTQGAATYIVTKGYTAHSLMEWLP